MGATIFSTTLVGKFKTSRDAYRKACQNANDYNGHQEGYSGDIQTTSGSFLYKNAPRYDTDKYWKWLDDMVEKNHQDGRGRCGAVEIKGSKLKELKNNNGLFGKQGVKAYHFFGWCKE